MNELQTEIAIKMAQEAVSFLMENHEGWNVFYFRFYRREIESGCSSSFSSGSKVKLLSSLSDDFFFNSLEKLSNELLNALDKKSAVLLLVVESNMNYEIKFEYKDFNRWMISKMDGGNGIPTD